MFCLIQRGQLYADGDGFPVTIHSCRDNRVVYRRPDNYKRSIGIGEFNNKFERLDYPEYRKIKMEMEQEENIRQLRKMGRCHNEKYA